MSGEPANFTLEDAARWRALRASRRRYDWRQPTLGELQKSTPWVRVYCDKCLHSAPFALAPFVIRWGAETSAMKLKRSARCTECGHKGATLHLPGWGGNGIGFLPFPVGYANPEETPA